MRMTSVTNLPSILSAVLVAATLLAHGARAQSSFASGAVFTSSNEAAGNAVVRFERMNDGTLGAPVAFATGGTGSGSGLGNQGAVVLSDNLRFLFAVNAGSNDVSVFNVTETGLMLVDRQSSGGMQPVSVAQHDDLVFVVNAGSNTVQGFRLAFDGKLTVIAGSNGPLSAAPAAPAQITFGSDGRNLYVTEKAVNRISQFGLDDLGQLASYHRLLSSGMTPFGFASGARNQLVVSEAFGGAANASAVSSYRHGSDGQLQLITGSLGTGETAACWIVAGAGGRLFYASNTGTNSITSLGTSFDGQLAVVNSVAATTGAGPTDMALTPDERFFYVLNAAEDTVGAYRVESDGKLSTLGVPIVFGAMAPTGLAAY